MRTRIALVIGILVCLGVAFGLAVGTAGAWDGMCGTHENPVPCDTTTTTEPETPPTPTEPEVVPPPAPPAPPAPVAPVPPAPPSVAPSVVTPPSTPPAANKQRKTKKRTDCPYLLRKGAGIRWLVKYKCRTKLPGPFNPPVTGEHVTNAQTGGGSDVIAQAPVMNFPFIQGSGTAQGLFRNSVGTFQVQLIAAPRPGVRAAVVASRNGSYRGQVSRTLVATSACKPARYLWLWATRTIANVRRGNGTTQTIEYVSAVREWKCRS